MVLNLIRKLWEYDILVMENMLADILSDLGGGLVADMGMAPYAKISKQHALFQQPMVLHRTRQSQSNGNHSVWLFTALLAGPVPRQSKDARSCRLPRRGRQESIGRR